jgi:hypothetical protein
MLHFLIRTVVLVLLIEYISLRSLFFKEIHLGLMCLAVELTNRKALYLKGRPLYRNVDRYMTSFHF